MHIFYAHCIVLSPKHKMTPSSVAARAAVLLSQGLKSFIVPHDQLRIDLFDRFDNDRDDDE